MKSCDLRFVCLGLSLILSPMGMAWDSPTNNVSTSASAPATPEQQIGNATAPSLNPSFSISDALNTFVGGLGSLFDSHGLQWKNPVLSPTLTYRSFDDTSPGGFAGNEYSGDLGFDVDIYDGLILGALYQHTYRGATNVQGTSERLESDGGALYLAKRFFDLLNVGLSYQRTETEHRLTRAVTSNLDRDANGGTVFMGVSKRKGLWSGSLTTSFGYVRDDYERQPDLSTGRVSVLGTINCDIVKEFSAGVGFGYHNFVIQDSFPDTVIRDKDYWTLGPRLRFYPAEEVTVRLDFETQEGYSDFKAYTVRLGMDFSF
ncbi:MAG: hypothetical protein IT578_08540 [Verrucomicrobiae bacterium]|nr:hypothetical protein [Verrucomicrobiae bacterium]